jgi:hypothetical protein
MLTAEQIDQLEKNVNAILNGKHREEVKQAFDMARGALRIDAHLAEQQAKFTEKVSSSPTEKTRVRDLERWLQKEQAKRRALEDAGRDLVAAEGLNDAAHLGAYTRAMDRMKKALER